MMPSHPLVSYSQISLKVLNSIINTSLPFQLPWPMLNHGILKFAQKIGDITGSEMNLFKINLWLAPALNIHRSILNGRNL
jgi:hypothetical protein